MLRLILGLLLTYTLHAKSYTDNQNTQAFIEKMVEVHQLDRAYLERLFSSVDVQKTPLRIIARDPNEEPTEEQKNKYTYYGAWDRYIKHKITPKRIKDGRRYLRKYKTTFARVEKLYGIPSEYIAAIIGIESAYGHNVGKYPVFDTLCTLAFEENRRSSFFKRELEKFLLLSHNNNFNPKKVKGSYAGAIGIGQFMPSSYEAFGVDFNHDGKVSLLHPHDAIASIANYLHKHGWQKDEEVATRVSYNGTRFSKYQTGYNRTYDRSELKGIKPKSKPWPYHDKVRLIKLNTKHHDELWYGAKNFYVITRYNHSAYYAMSVHQLATKIKEIL